MLFNKFNYIKNNKINETARPKKLNYVDLCKSPPSKSTRTGPDWLIKADRAQYFSNI